jgi:uncharacterized heparinase superfamily protein
MRAVDYFHTLRCIKPEQVYGLLIYRYPRPIGRDHLATSTRPVTGSWRPPIQPPPLQIEPGHFRLAAGDRKVLNADGWEDSNTPKLWLYNLHYFDDLSAKGKEGCSQWHRDLIARWIRENPPCQSIGWDPYPTSCRIVNWIKWALSGESLDRSTLASLATQARHLRRNMEWRLMGNHLMANMKALVLAGCFLYGNEPDQWLRDGVRMLEKRLPEQVLADGGHCEQSPMYHLIVLCDLLDLVNAAHAYPDCIPASACQLWEDTCRSMFRWLDIMCHPDGGASFFSDGGFASYAPADMKAYAGRLGLSLPDPCKQRLVHLKESGYIRMCTADTLLLFDVGEIGPQYQPGHGHADALSFELSHKGRRILVNPGTSTYSDGAERRWQRSTAAHNTLEVDGQDQSEMWGAFRVARRAHPLGVRSGECEGSIFAEAAHDGYRRLHPGVTHWRALELTGDQLIVTDTLDGSGIHSANVWFHFHPDLAVRAEGQWYFGEHAGSSAGIELDSRLTGSIVTTTFNPRFGVTQQNCAVCGAWSGSCPVSFTTRILLS